MRVLLALLAAATLLMPSRLARAQDSQLIPLAQSLLRQLVNINTTQEQGTTAAAQAMAERFRQAGFPAADIHLLSGNAKQQNLVVVLHGTGAKPPILLLGHLDVVEARRQDWSTDPFHLVEKDGYFYGRGTQDMKDGDAIFAACLIRMKQQGYRPNRDIVLALTAGEESGVDNGVAWLLAHQRHLILAGFVLNADGGGVDAVHGKPVYLAVDASEKRYADFQFSVTDRGGHSSLPRPDNAIYRLAAALEKVQRYQFPAELNAVTRGYLEARSHLDQGQRSTDERTLAAGPKLPGPPEAAGVQRLSQDPLLNATLRTTCVATRLQAGDANNALPQNAEALINCRILPGHSPLETQRTLDHVVADSQVKVQYMDSAGQLFSQAPADVSPAPVRLEPQVMDPLRRLTTEMFHVPVVPDMSTGATDGKYTNAAGLPTYALSGISIDEDDVRAHGRDERLKITSFNNGAVFYARFLRLLSGGR